MQDLKVFGNFRGFIQFEPILAIFYAIGHIFIVVNDQTCKRKRKQYVFFIKLW